MSEKTTPNNGVKIGGIKMTRTEKLERAVVLLERMQAIADITEDYLMDFSNIKEPYFVGHEVKRCSIRLQVLKNISDESFRFIDGVLCQELQVAEREQVGE